MNYTVPILSIIFMAVSALIGIAIPVVLFLIFRKKYKADILPFFIGCAIFILFALILESIIHSLVLASEAGRAITNNIWVYGIYVGLMAGLFEETGRFTAFKTVLKKNLGNNPNALMYGAGHGGFEAIYLLVGNMISHIVMSVTLNNGMGSKLTTGITDPAALQRVNATIAALAGAQPTDFLMGSIERFAAVGPSYLLIGSRMVCRKGRRTALLALSSCDFPACIDGTQPLLFYRITVSNLWIIEGCDLPYIGQLCL